MKLKFNTIFDVIKKRELRTVPNSLAVMLNVMKHLKIGILRLPDCVVIK